MCEGKRDIPSPLPPMTGQDGPEIRPPGLPPGVLRPRWMKSAAEEK